MFKTKAEKVWFWVAFGLFLLFITGIPFYAYAAETYVAPMYLPYTPDSVVQYWDKDGTATRVQKFTGTTTISDTLTLSTDTLHTIYYRVWWPGYDSSDCYILMRDLRVSAGTKLMRTPVYLSSATDSIIARQYVDGVLTNTRKRLSGQQSYDTTWSMTRQQALMINYLIYFDGATLPQNWVIQSYWDSTGASGSAEPASADLAYVTGTVRFIDGNPAWGAVVTAVRTSEPFGLDTSGGSGVFYLPFATSVTTGSDGSFSLTLVRSSTTIDTAYYDITIMFDNVEIGKVSRVYVPDSGNLDLGAFKAEQ